MADIDTVEEEEEAQEAVEATYFRQFLENTHPSVVRPIHDLWKLQSRGGVTQRVISPPDLRLYCQQCGGDRTFRCPNEEVISVSRTAASFNVYYQCGDCHDQTKLFSLYAIFNDKPSGQLYKYGEMPPFGVPVPNKVLRLFGKDAKMFQKGRQCENLGYGVAAFAYYRRVVENHKNDIFEEIIKVCRTVNAPQAIIDELQQAKQEIAFTKAIGAIKSALPQGLLINGHNPLLALHGALSVGLHDESDEDCLAAAQAVRLVLTDLVEKIATLKQDDKQLHDAVQLLLRKKS
ncbi:hypothetical protein EOS93_15355 [Rhizobium sp. RMa-01]|uniref:hypothetical protein n=1 Tax=unclassified Rhizobium TaxID=2613769 RepID=UPI0008D9175C|nr:MULTISPECIES: hypothetical protein [unclassified Rhizobium]OHV26653.1 hypothetical protein BBJ66_01165 [Rhizobium sp. RSm-3]RVU10119.1 hypothetical protein EOS93_15355 [Rhizobium sp. RMa-01]